MGTGDPDDSAPRTRRRRRRLILILAYFVGVALLGAALERPGHPLDLGSTRTASRIR